MDTVPVTLVVKVPNQNFDDYTIQCEASWTIKRLKEHLSEVYPCKPNTEEQKLIYSGQLLTDKVIIKDILRHYDGTHPPVHTFHLVYTPKIKQTVMEKTNSQVKQPNSNDGSTNSDGLRQRNVQGSSSSNIDANTRTQQTITTNQNNIPQQTLNNPITNCPTSSIPNVNGNLGGFSFPNQPSNEYFMAQQMAVQNWMQQAYTQYMNQYMNLLSLGVRPETIYMQNQPPATPLQPTVGVSRMPYLPQNFPLTNSNLPSSSGASSLANDGADTRIPAPASTSQTAIAQVQQPAPEPENQPPQPRFPNIVQEELPENRDWLDVFYTISRLMMLLTLVCFYSSPLRCLVVLTIGLTIYLYHIGLFRPPNLQANEANNNNNNNNNNNINNRGEQAENRQQEQGQQQQPNAQQPNAILGGDNNAQLGVNAEQTPTVAADAVSTDAPDVANNATSVIAFIRTFVVSFFVSLLPDAQAL